MDLNHGYFIKSLSYSVEVFSGAVILFFLFVDSIIGTPYLPIPILKSLFHLIIFLVLCSDHYSVS